jgi:hypothetical protein
MSSSYQRRLKWRRRHDLKATNIELTTGTFERIARAFPGQPYAHVMRYALNELLDRMEHSNEERMAAT